MSSPGNEEGPGSSAVIEAVEADLILSSRYGGWVPFLVSSCLPSVYELEYLYRTDIRDIFFVGELDDVDAVGWLNRLSKTVPEQGFRVVQLSKEKE